ncbi:temptin-like [Mytilus californianus]|uniref:temptin-like n=1 Tax=Mytilus californianus TaxID=6549 RepID=UPI0022484536|nr:temptin-like [Mytilus californianus]
MLVSDNTPNKCMKMMYPAHILALCIVIVNVCCYEKHQKLIPNGNNVPNPCSKNQKSIWRAVGHFNPDHGGVDINSFGKDFMLYNKTWTTELCLIDSDGDGKINGEELGDPSCDWTPGKKPKGPATDHPGICEPVDSDMCKRRNQGFKQCPK